MIATGIKCVDGLRAASDFAGVIGTEYGVVDRTSLNIGGGNGVGVCRCSGPDLELAGVACCEARDVSGSSEDLTGSDGVERCT